MINLEIIGQLSEVKLGNIEPNREVQYFEILDRSVRFNISQLNGAWLSNNLYWLITVFKKNKIYLEVQYSQILNL